MLPLSVVEEIDRLLKEGELSQRRIAERLKVSRGTVSAIASGQRGLHGRTPADETKGETPALPAERCPKCGFLVYKPCLVCRTRVYRQGRRVLASLAAERLATPRQRRRLPLRRRHRTCRARVA
jgi:Helix-turn-helix domain